MIMRIRERIIPPTANKGTKGNWRGVIGVYGSLVASAVGSGE
jgi:hypothetical protein